MQQVAQELEAASGTLLRRIHETGKLLLTALTEGDLAALVVLEVEALVVRSDDFFRDPNGQGHEVVVLRVTPLGREVLRELPRQAAR